MALIEIRPSDLRSRANELETQRQKQMETMKRLRVLVMGLNESWKGESQTAFANRFLANQHTMDELSQTLEEYIELARQAANEADAVDNELLAAVRRI